MSDERKKAQPKPVTKPEPKKRLEPNLTTKVDSKKIPEAKVTEKLKPVLIFKKKSEPKPITNQVVQQNKNVEPIIDPKIELYLSEKVEGKVKRSEDKYVRIALDAKVEEKNEFGLKVKNGDLKYMYYAIDNDKGYFYYLILKK
jgi:hypothetical protein